MTDAIIAAARVFDLDAIDLDERHPEVSGLPRYLQVHIPAISEVRTYDLNAVSAAQIWMMLEHGASQRLGDAAAGKTDQAARDAVTKREKTLWADGRTAVKTDPVTAEMHKIVCDILRRPKSEGGKGLKTKELPTLKEFPSFLAEQDQDAVAKIKAVAERNVATAAEAKKDLSL